MGLVTDTGRVQYANTTPKGLRLAAELLEAGADIQKIFTRVYETVQFAKLKLLGRALDRAQAYEDGRVVVSYLLRTDFSDVGAEEPFSEGIIDFLRQTEGAQLVALIREPPTPGGPTHRIYHAPAPTHSTSRRSPGSPGAAATCRGPGSRARTRSRRSWSSSAVSSSRRPAPGSETVPRAASPVGVVLVDKPPGPSSFALVAELRRRTQARTGHTGTLDPFASGLLTSVVRNGNWNLLHALLGSTSTT